MIAWMLGFTGEFVSSVLFLFGIFVLLIQYKNLKFVQDVSFSFV